MRCAVKYEQHTNWQFCVVAGPCPLFRWFGSILSRRVWCVPVHLHGGHFVVLYAIVLLYCWESANAIRNLTEPTIVGFLAERIYGFNTHACQA